MSFIDSIQSEQGIVWLGTAIGGLWALFKSSGFLVRCRNQRYRRAILTLEAAAEETYRTYVRAIKEARVDGKLTDEERDQARRLALGRAVELGRTQGIDLLQELGEAYLNLHLTRLVQRLKRA